MASIWTGYTWHSKKASSLLPSPSSSATGDRVYRSSSSSSASFSFSSGNRNRMEKELEDVPLRLHLSQNSPLLPVSAPSPAPSSARLRVRGQAQGDYSAPSSSPPPPSDDDTDLDAGDYAHQPSSWSSIILPFLFPALGGLLFGYDIGATSGATVSLQSAELSGTTWFSLSAVQLGLVVSGSLYGALAGSLLAYPIADTIGRRVELITAALLYIAGGLITGCAPDLLILIIGRLVYGIGIGMAMHGAPLYIAETSPSQIRGTLISLKELFIVLGILLGYLMGSLEIDTVGGWRYMYGMSAPLAAVMAVGMLLMPSSPRWLLLRAAQGKGPMEEYKQMATDALRKLRGRPAGDRASQKEVEDTLASLKAAYSDGEPEGSIWEVFEGPSLKAFTIGGGLVLFQQITGQPSVLYYAASILQRAGFTAASDAARVSVVIGLFKLIMTGIAVSEVDNLGRRPLLIGGVSGIVFSLFLLAAYYKFLSSFPLVAVGALLLYVGCYQVSFGPISWLMVSEIFPLRTRGRGISLAVLINFGSNALVTFAFSPLTEILGADNIFIFFGAIALLSLIFVYLNVPETKGLSLEEIESKILKSGVDDTS